MSRDVIKYGPAEPITNPITNPAPIEHGLVMDDAGHAEATLDRLMAANRQPATSKRVLFDAAALLAASAWRETLAANLATAGALELAFKMGCRWERSWDCGEQDETWFPGCGRPMPGWGG